MDRDAPLPKGKTIDRKKPVEHVDHGDKTSEANLTRMIEDKSPENLEVKEVLDVETLSSRTQDRLWHALKERYHYNASIKRGQDFLLKHVSTKISLVIMYVDLKLHCKCCKKEDHSMVMDGIEGFERIDSTDQT